MFENLKEELRKKDFNVSLFCTNVLIGTINYVLWSQAITDDEQKIIHDIQSWLKEQKENRDLNEALDNVAIAKSVNNLLKGDKTKANF